MFNNEGNQHQRSWTEQTARNNPNLRENAAANSGSGPGKAQRASPSGMTSVFLSTWFSTIQFSYLLGGNRTVFVPI
jgi:hypothetical protein